jgi:carbamoyl-phosphate synthase large subunit
VFLAVCARIKSYWISNSKNASLLAVGYTLDEIPNFITQKTPASLSQQ